ncbi:superoxide dismutase family protein [Elizabethkingia argentiflava]|uniref:Superoxide dismutase family protein n=1 Tax=Elizabethkingia argenteiflava TaxID=2681556 RepID=A0A845PUS7_9FLAO|nr:superoxide dismutase family protein [Elizabethkingia argenteiflava]NAW51584.1 superoxide dismutase family protein [Elizabethkingia argenteiflava]
MKNLKLFSLGLMGALMLASCAASKEVNYVILPKSDTSTGGKVSFKQKGNTVMMDIAVTGLTPGEHAVHIHDKADCSAADATSTGGHWNPAGNDHGKWESEHFHMGDIGNLTADVQGNADLSFKTDKWCIGCNDVSKNILNHGLIIHSGADDFHTQPTGNAGGRVGCVEIK